MAAAEAAVGLAIIIQLYRLKSSKVLSFGERKMLDNAKQLIVKELAVAKKWAEDKVEQELEKACA